jgi:2-aminoethylphosphonate-pyruvate transaminase
MILLNPGPVTLTPRVRSALLREDLCHRESEFAELTLDIRSRLEGLYPAAGYAAVLITGSGSAAVEAMLTTMVPPAAKTLVVANGVYGERIAAMLARHRRPHATVQGKWTDGISMTQVEAALSADPALRYVICVHNETTTGRLNDVDALGRLCRARGVYLLLDAVSSFGAEDLRFAEWNLVAAAATGNKCLHSTPGVSFVLARLDALESAKDNADTVVLDLARHFREQRQGWSPFTQSVHGFFALQEALRELEEAGGRNIRRERYAALSNRLRDTLPGLGAALLIPAADSASMLTAFKLPQGVRYDALHDSLKRAGFVIYAGQGALAPAVFRVATMGAVGDADMDRLLAAFRAAL